MAKASCFKCGRSYPRRGKGKGWQVSLGLLWCPTCVERVKSEIWGRKPQAEQGGK